MIEAYHGDEPYLFASYAHADSELVFREIDRLTKLGVRIWYDEGIDAGNDWPDEIGRALAASALVIVFISPSSAASKNVQNEINFALNRGKPFLAVYLEETQLPVGLELRMGDIQALMKYGMEDVHYFRKLDRVLPHEIRTKEKPQTSIPAKRLAVPLQEEIQKSVSLRWQTRHGERNVCVAVGNHGRLGKDRSNDFVLRVLPRSSENDRRSRQISGLHAEVSIETDIVLWRNVNCSNGTLVDGEHIGPTEQAVLRSGMPIRPANVLPLQADIFDGAHFDTPADFSALNALGKPGSFATIPEGRINAVTLRRTDDLRHLEQYVLVHRGALLGRGPTCAVRIDHPSLSNRHAKLYGLHGGLWIEPMDAASVVVVNGTRLALDELAALTPGTELQCGAVTVEVTPRFQHELGFLKPQPQLHGKS